MRFTKCLKQLSQTVDTSFVPAFKSVKGNDLELLQNFISESKKLFVLTGAGLSTESGIPDYRSEKVGLYARSTNRPIQQNEFLSSEYARRRYWARNFAAWPQFSQHQPNIAHRVFAEWEEKGKISWLATQNIDRLHKKAGSKKMTELHGSTYLVLCLSCPETMSRDEAQILIEEANPQYRAKPIEVAPDGDVQLSDEDVANFKMPPCPSCGGILKPDVVFFGDHTKFEIVDFLYDEIAKSDSMLVAGSSLYVYSGRRFVFKAKELKKPIAILNIGETRADHLADLKIPAKLGDILPRIKV